MPKVSVVIPTFGRVKLLRRAIEGVLTQSIHDLEVIVVVDGDDPETRSYLLEITDHRVRSIFHESNKGAGEARNTGALASLGDWVAFLDDDDEWLPQKLEKQLAAVSSEPVVLITLSKVVTPLGTFIRPGDPYQNDLPLDEWLFGRRSWLKGGQSFLQTSSLMLPRRIFETLRFSTAKQHEDWELVIRVVKQLGYKLVTVLEPLVIHYLDERPTLSKSQTWQGSLDWANSLGDLLTPRAYSGFCLTVISHTPAELGNRSACLPLLKAAFKNGRPTAKQLFAFAMLWLLPVHFRLRIRARMDRYPE